MLRPVRRLVAAWTRWVAFLSQREPGTSLAVFRIACGLCLAGEIGACAARGLVPVLWLDEAFGGYRKIDGANWLVQMAGGAAPRVVWTLVVVCLASAAALALGWHGRVAALAALQSYLALASLNRQILSSYSLLLCNALWLLVLARNSATLSLDCRRRTGAWTSNEPVPAWPRYLAVFQLMVMYLSTGVQKIGSDWPLGGGLSALYYTLQQPAWRRFDMTWLAWVYPLTQLATAVSWLWEVAAPVWLLAFYFGLDPHRDGRLRRRFGRFHVKTVFLVLGVIFHVQILVFMEVGMFSWVSLSYYVCLFSPSNSSAVRRGDPALRN